jgi:hypothetical protein
LYTFSQQDVNRKNNYVSIPCTAKQEFSWGPSDPFELLRIEEYREICLGIKFKYHEEGDEYDEIYHRSLRLLE